MTSFELFESLSSHTAVLDSSRLALREYSGFGLSEDDPVVLVVELEDATKRPARAIRKNVIWKSLSISCRFPKNGKFREIVEIARKFLVTTANFLQGLEIVRLFSNMQLTFA